MKKLLADLLRCPACLGELDSVSFRDAQGEMLEGVLQCRTPGCCAWYPVTGGIPRMLSPELRQQAMDEFTCSFRNDLARAGISPGTSHARSSDPLGPLKKHTIQNFGYEWTEYARFGWDDPVYNIAHEEKVFLRKALLNPEVIRGKIVLDAGCGNGRYTYWAARHGGEVVGMDLGAGVESAYKNNSSLPNVHIVQGDILSPPFGRAFDIVFSIGVLMHTGNARQGVASLAKKLKPGGSLTAHLYGKGNPVYEFLDSAIRRRTTKMTIERLSRLTHRLHAAARALRRARLFGAANYLVRLDDHPHCIFDWYSAPVATHHTYYEVRKWFQDCGLTVIQTNEQEPETLAGRIKYALGAPTVTVRGVLSSAAPTP